MTTFEENRAACDAALARFRTAPLPHFIAGRPSLGTSGATFANLTPIDGSVIGQVACANATDVDAACTAAAAAFPAWRALPGDARRLLHRVADAIEARGAELALIESHDTGQPLRFMSKAAVRAAENFRFFADRAPGANDGLALPAMAHLNYSCASPSDRSA